MVILKKVTYVNFCSIKEAEVDLESQGLVLITGKNGSGKSALYIDGVYYALYGESFRYGERPGDSIVRRFKESIEDSYVKITFSVDGDSYEIVRSRKHSVYPKGVSLFSDGKDISRGTAQETQKVIDDLLGMSPNTFKHSVIFEPNMLKFPSLSDTEKKAIFDELLQLACFEPALKETKEALKAAVALKKTAESNLKVLGENLISTQRKVSTALAEEGVWNSSRDDRLKAIQDLIDEETKKVADISLKISLVNKPPEIDVSKKEIKYQNLSKGIVDERNLLSADQRSAFAIKVKKETEIENLNKELKRLRNLSAEGKCHACGQPIKLNHNVDAIPETEKALNDASDILAETYTTIKSLEERDLEIEEYTKKAVELKVEIEKSKESLNDYNSKMRNLEYEKKLNEVEEANLRKRFESEANSVNPFSNTVQVCREEELSISEKISSISEDLKGICKVVEDETVLEELFGAKGAKLLMVQTALPLLNREAAKVQSIMGTDIKVSFELKDAKESFAGTLQVVVQNPKGAASYAGDSTGERSRVDIIILLSLLSLAASRGRKSFEQVFFDEVFENIDTIGQTGALAVIKDISSTKSSVFVISHTADELGGQCDKQILIDDGKIAA